MVDVDCSLGLQIFRAGEIQIYSLTVVVRSHMWPPQDSSQGTPLLSCLPGFAQRLGGRWGALLPLGNLLDQHLFPPSHAWHFRHDLHRLYGESSQPSGRCECCNKHLLLPKEEMKAQECEGAHSILCCQQADALLSQDFPCVQQAFYGSQWTGNSFFFFSSSSFLSETASPYVVQAALYPNLPASAS